MTRITTLLAVAATLAFAAPAATATTTSGGANNVVLVSTTADGAQLARSSLQTSLVGGPTIASANLAQAEATDCTGCRSVAVAVQAVFGSGDVSTFVPTNAAVAVNAGCSACESVAFAYQYVLGTDGPVRFTLEGQQELSDLRARFAEVASSGLAPDELDAQLDALASEFKQTVDEQMQQAGVVAAGTVHVQRSARVG